MSRDNFNFTIRPTQLTNVFGPGAIYDNEEDSLIIMGLDYWETNISNDNFPIIAEELLLQQIKRDIKFFDNLESLVSVSTSKEDATIPVKSFPRWGVCPVCHKLKHGRKGSNDGKKDVSFYCDSTECRDAKKNKDKRIPSTEPVRFVMACANGHLDEFPWYEWVHKGEKERSACSKTQALLYLRDTGKSSSLKSKYVECTNCNAQTQNMAMSLTESGLRGIIFFDSYTCTKNMPWLKDHAAKCNAMMSGIFKGASNFYFPRNIRAVTIPPFSDEIAQWVVMKAKQIENNKRRGGNKLRVWLQGELDLYDEEKDQDGHTIDDYLDKIKKLDDFRQNNAGTDIRSLEFNQLNSKDPTRSKDFVTESIQVPASLQKQIGGITLVKKLRVVSALTGFTRINPFDFEQDNKEKRKSKGLVPNNRITRIHSGQPRWLPVIENRGEGIFLSFKNSVLKNWATRPEVEKRMKQLLTFQGKKTSAPKSMDDFPGYVFLHTMSHLLIKGMGKSSGYPTSSFEERIYSGKEMAGILIFTSASSRDGSLGGLVDLVTKQHYLETMIRNSISASSVCSTDPLCSTQEPEAQHNCVGASCHACSMLPETSCESQNNFLDRAAVYRTLTENIGLFGDG